MPHGHMLMGRWHMRYMGRRCSMQILKLKGRIATLAAEIADLTKQIKENEEAQAEATAIREKENADFMKEKTEMEQAVNDLERAILW